MTFDEKREQVLLAKDIGKILDAEGPEDERAALLRRIEETDGGQELLEQMSKDNTLLQNAVSAPVPDESMARFEALIDREFDKRQGLVRHPEHGSWTGVLVQIAAALVMVAGTFAFTTYWMQTRMDNAVSSLAAHMETERVLLAQTVQEALETKVSGEPVLVGQEGNWTEVLTPIKTYRSKSGHWCRQYLRQTTFSKLDLSIRGTACRDESGTWVTVFAEPISDNFSPETPGI
jgi:surface antigen